MWSVQVFLTLLDSNLAVAIVVFDAVAGFGSNPTTVEVEVSL